MFPIQVKKERNTFFSHPELIINDDEGKEDAVQLKLYSTISFLCVSRVISSEKNAQSTKDRVFVIIARKRQQGIGTIQKQKRILLYVRHAIVMNEQIIAWKGKIQIVLFKIAK